MAFATHQRKIYEAPRAASQNRLFTDPSSQTARLHRSIVIQLVESKMAESLYSDKLISITDRDIIFYHYYFPTGKRKHVKMDDIECIAVLAPLLRNGKWRIHGTGNLKVWFPKDKQRPQRDRIFIATLKNQWVDIGFTVEDGASVENLLIAKNLIKRNHTGHSL